MGGKKGKNGKGNKNVKFEERRIRKKVRFKREKGEKY